MASDTSSSAASTNPTPADPHVSADPDARTPTSRTSLTGRRLAVGIAVFLLSAIALTAVQKDVRSDRIVQLALEMREVPGFLAREVFTSAGKLIGFGLVLMYVLAVASGTRVRDYLMCWWWGLPALLYFSIPTILRLPPISETLLKKDAQNVLFHDYGFYTIFLCGSLIVASLMRRFLTLCIARGARVSFPKVRSPRLLAILVICGLAFAAGHTVNSYYRYKNFKIFATDTGIYDQLLYMATQGRLWHCPIFTTNENRMADFGDNYNAEHYMPSIMLMLPLYMVWAHPIWLWVVQTLSIAGAAVLAYLLAIRLTGSPGLGFAAGFALLADPIVSRTLIEDFHPDAVVPFFVLGMFLAYHHRRFVWYWTMMALAMGLKEDYSVYIALVGIYQIIGQRDWKWGLATFLVGISWHLGVTKLIIEPLRAGEPMRVLERYSWLHPQGAQPSGMGELIAYFLRYPDKVWEWTMEQRRVLVPIRLFAPLFFLGLLRPATFVFLAPAAAVHFYSSWYEQSVFWRYHGTAVVPFYLYAGLLGLQRLVHGRVVRPSFPSSSAEFPPLPDATGVRPEIDSRSLPKEPFWRPFWSGGGFYPRIVVRSSAQTVLTRGLAVGLVMFSVLVYRELSQGPFGRNWHYQSMKRHAHYAKADEAHALIPRNAIVCVQNKHAPSFTHRNLAYLFPDIRPDVTHILLDTRGHAWPFDVHPDQFRDRVRGLMSSGEWGVLTDETFDGIVVLERGADTSNNMRVFESLRFGYYKWETGED